jgi:hypothetical protein
MYKLDIAIFGHLNRFIIHNLMRFITGKDIEPATIFSEQ